MSYVDHEAIYDAFAPKVTAFANGYSPALPVAYPGLTFETPSEGAWLEIVSVRNGGEEYGMGNYGPADVMGFYRVNVCTRPGQGINTGAAIAEALADAIRKGTEIGPARIYQMPRISGPIQDDNRVMQPVTFRYRGTRRLETTRVYVLVGQEPGSYLKIE